MRLPGEFQMRWLEMARRLKAMTPATFYHDNKYDPIRDELAQLAWKVVPADFALIQRVAKLAPPLVPTPEWAADVSPEEVLCMLLTVIANERWVDGCAAEPHRNGFLSYALECVAAADGAFELRQ